MSLGHRAWPRWGQFSISLSIFWLRTLWSTCKVLLLLRQIKYVGTKDAFITLVIHRPAFSGTNQCYCGECRSDSRHLHRKAKGLQAPTYPTPPPSPPPRSACKPNSHLKKNKSAMQKMRALFTLYSNQHLSKYIVSLMLHQSPIPCQRLHTIEIGRSPSPV